MERKLSNNLFYAHSIPDIMFFPPNILQECASTFLAVRAVMCEIDEFGCLVLPRQDLDLGTEKASYVCPAASLVTNVFSL